MTHEELRDRLLDLAYGELSPRDAREVEAHAASCEACGAELARIRGTRRIMASLPEEPAPERGERLLLAAAREAARRRAPRPWVPRWAWATAVAAASLVAVAAVSWRIVAMRPGGIGREDPRALLGDSQYAREPGEAAPRDARVAEGEEAPKLGAAPEKAAPTGRDTKVRPPPSPPAARKFATPPSEARPPAPAPPPSAAPPERAPERSDYAAAPPPPAEEQRPMAAARPQRALSAEAAPPHSAAEPTRDEAFPPPSPPRSGGEGRGEGAAAAPSRAPAAPSAGARAKASVPAAPAAVLRYQELRGAGRLRGEIQTFPGCDGEVWRKVERDPDGRVVSYAREGLVGGRRVRVDVVYGPDGAPARVTVRDAATMAALDGAAPWIPRAADADGPPRCAE